MPPMVSSEYHVVATGIAARLSAAEMDTLERCVTDTSDPARGFNALYVLLARHRRALDAGRFRGCTSGTRHASTGCPCAPSWTPTWRCWNRPGPTW